MVDRLHDQLKGLGIKDDPALLDQTKNDLRRIEAFREQLWLLSNYEEVVLFVRKTISSELSRKLEHIITPPKAVGLAEDVSLDSIKWFVEYWWSTGKASSPDLAVAADNTVVAYWQEQGHALQIRFFSSGFALVSIKHFEQGRESKSSLQMPVRQLPSSFVS
jgi:hypothetical protein